MAWLVLLGSGFFLASISRLDQTWLQIVLILSFLVTGLIVRKGTFHAYLVFIFLYPFLPSQSAQLSSFDLLEFLFLCFAFWWAFERIKSKNPHLPKTVLNPVLALLMAVFSMSVLISLLQHHYVFTDVFFLKIKDYWNIFQANPGSDLTSVRNLIYFCEGVLFFYISVDVLDSDRIHKSVRVILYSAALVSVLAVLQKLLRFNLLEYWIKENPNIVRVNSTFSDPNSLGTYLATVLCCSVYAYQVWNSRMRRLQLLLASLVLLALIFTASRAAWAATFLTLLILPATAKWFGMDPSPHFRGAFLWLARRGIPVAAAIVFLSFGAGLAINYADPHPDSLLKIVLFTFNPHLSLNEILKGRVELWKTAMHVFQDYPIFGSGLGSFRFLENAPYFVTFPENAHNYFLQLLAETGFVGLFLFCLVIGFAFREVRRKLRALAPDRDQFLLTFGLLSGLVAFLLTSLTGHPLLLLKLQFVFWSFIGALMAQSRTASSTSRSHSRYLFFIVFAIAISFVCFLRIRATVQPGRIAAYEHGYNAWERDLGGSLFRWTTGEAISVLKVQGEILSLKLRQFGDDVRKRPTSAKIYLNDQLLDTIYFFETDWKALKYFLPPLVTPGEAATLRIVSDKVFVPKDPRDKRKLGVAVGNFTWECSAESPMGVHEKENQGDKTYYWTRMQSSFFLPRSGNHVSFRLLPNLSADTAPLDVQFYWNLERIRSMSFNASRWEPVSLQIPDKGGSSGVLTIRVSRIVNLKKMNLGEDSRDLGVRVEFPVRWGGASPTRISESRALKNPSFYGISNNGNRPLRLLLYTTDHTSSVFQVSENGTHLKYKAGLFESISPKEADWTRLYPKTPHIALKDSFVWKGLDLDVYIPSGPSLMRMTALGPIDVADVPLISLRIDGHEVARQPILFSYWNDYYFQIDLPSAGRKISVEFLNDFYDPAQAIDRNLFIKEIAVAKKNSTPKMDAGWESLQNRILIAEPVDRDFAFSPWNHCYTLQSKK